VILENEQVWCNFEHNLPKMKVFISVLWNLLPMWSFLKFWNTNATSCLHYK